MSDAPLALADRVAVVRDRIAAACAAAGRDVAEVTLVGVTKTHAPEVLRALVAAGVRDLGENRVQELVAKQAALTHEDVRWHLIGPLQRNKAADVTGRVDLVHTVDRRKLVDRLQRLAEEADVVQRVLVQVNVGADPAKHGCDLSGWQQLLTYAAGQTNLAVAGLMTVPPLPPPGTAPAVAARPHFARLRELRDLAQREVTGCDELSMGMSADLDAAVAEGATLVRVGTALLGPRGSYQPDP